MSHLYLRHVVVALGCMALYVILDKTTLALQILPNVSAWYPPAALTFAALFGIGLWYMPIISLASCICLALNYHLPIAFWNDMSAVLGIAFYTFMAWLFRDVFRLDLRLRRMRDVILFAVLMMPAAMGVAALAVGLLSVTGEVPRAIYGKAVLAWGVGDAAAFLSIVPFLLQFVVPSVRRFLGMEKSSERARSATKRRRTARDWVEIAAQVVSIPLALWIAFGSGEHAYYACFIPVVWIAVRQGLRATSAVLLAVNIGAVAAFGYFHLPPPGLTNLQFFMLALGLTSLLLGALIEERKLSEQALREGAADLQRAQAVAHIGSWYYDIPHDVLTCSDEAYRMFEIPAGIPLSLRTFLDAVHPDDRELVSNAWACALRGESYGIEHRIIVKETTKWVSEKAEVEFDEGGRALRGIGTIQEITERKRLEAQYEQAQKMEAVGRLAGGIAHDFNNILGIILGYTELSDGLLTESHPLYRNNSQIKQAAERAASLTRQLLTFSRQQVTRPTVLDLNQVVGNLSEMLARLVGEDVELTFTPGSKHSRIKADPVQIEQILMNLGVNSRDAMPAGGKIVIETSDVTFEATAEKQEIVVPGAYVMMSFCDTGCGIDPEKLGRVFEPFFTTKGPGAGTGLGLATVYGIVKQNNGYVWVYSELNKGTTFKICFPQVAEVSELEQPPGEADAKGGMETILLVEDEPDLRDVAATLLQRNGYKVLQAGDGKAALVVAGSYAGKIDLLLTDVIMPAMRGPELCANLRTVRPEIKVLYMSGYPSGQLGNDGQLSPGTELLEKPFKKTSLLQKVKSVLQN